MAEVSFRIIAKVASAGQRKDGYYLATTIGFAMKLPDPDNNTPYDYKPGDTLEITVRRLRPPQDLEPKFVPQPKPPSDLEAGEKVSLETGKTRAKAET